MKTKRFIFLLLIIMILFQLNVYAADGIYRLMHNDHLALVIGEVVTVEEKSIGVRVTKNIVSAKDLNVSAKKQQLKLSNADIKAPIEYYSFNSDRDGAAASPAIGDFILVSLEES